MLKLDVIRVLAAKGEHGQSIGIGMNMRMTKKGRWLF